MTFTDIHMTEPGDKKYSYNDDMCYQKRKLSVF